MATALSFARPIVRASANGLYPHNRSGSGYAWVPCGWNSDSVGRYRPVQSCRKESARSSDGSLRLNLR